MDGTDNYLNKWKNERKSVTPTWREPRNCHCAG